MGIWACTEGLHFEKAEGGVGPERLLTSSKLPFGEGWLPHGVRSSPPALPIGCINSSAESKVTRGQPKQCIRHLKGRGLLHPAAFLLAWAPFLAQSK